MISYHPINLKPQTIDQSDYSNENQDGSNKTEPTLLPENDIHLFKEKILRQEKEKLKINKIKKTKLFLLLILSHFLVFLLATPSNNLAENKSTKPTFVEFKILSKNYSYTSPENSNINIDVYNEQLELILENVELVHPKESEDSSLKLNNTDYNLHIIRVNKTMASKIINLLDGKFLIYPNGIAPPIKKKIRMPKSSPSTRDPYQKKWEIL